MSESFSHLFGYFFLYSVIGWLCETVWCSVGSRRYINRGFLSGPYCPIYGFAALTILAVTLPVRDWPPLVFLIAVLVSTLLEYLTGWLLETIFQMRWWDYSGRRFQLHGRICLRNALLFGLLGLAMTYLIHPLCQQLLGGIATETLRVITSLLFAVMVLDLIHTLSTLANLRERIETVNRTMAELHRMQETYRWFDPADLAGSAERLRAICREEPENGEAAHLLARLEQVLKRQGSVLRILRAFPKIRPVGLPVDVEAIGRQWQTGWQRRRETRRDLSGRIGGWWQEKREAIRTAYRGISFQKLVWVFIVGCLAGYIVETIYCLVTRGVIESRQGMVYGPFNQVYGFGAVLMVLLLIPFQVLGDGFLFVAGAWVGGLFEAACSLFQEVAFGTVSWEYSHHQFSLFGGRTSLTYMFFWGILAVFFMKFLYPPVSRLIDRIPKRPGRFFTTLLSLALLLDMALSAMAVARWSERQAGEAPSNGVEIFLDAHYPDAMLEEIYPNMMPSDKLPWDTGEAD